MKVKELAALCAAANPEAEVLIRLSGSIYPTDTAQETADYNHDPDPGQPEFFIVANEEF